LHFDQDAASNALKKHLPVIR
jgi:chaperonin cofactor prefoldin